MYHGYNVLDWFIFSNLYFPCATYSRAPESSRVNNDTYKYMIYIFCTFSPLSIVHYGSTLHLFTPVFLFLLFLSPVFFEVWRHLGFILWFTLWFMKLREASFGGYFLSRWCCRVMTPLTASFWASQGRSPLRAVRVRFVSILGSVVHFGVGSLGAVCFAWVGWVNRSFSICIQSALGSKQLHLRPL